MTYFPHASTRRGLLKSAGATFCWAFAPSFARADARDPRLITIILRGALDGLSAVGPIGDPNYAGLHGQIALSLSGERPALPLDGFFAVNPGMPGFQRLFHAGQAAVVHAVATPYRSRSHFDGQDVLESGYSGPGKTDSGWLNRAIQALPAGRKIGLRAEAGLAVGATTPLVIRGPAAIVEWSPSALAPASSDTEERLLDLYRQRDPSMRAALAAGLGVEKQAGQMASIRPRGGSDSASGMRQAARGAAKILAAADGPRIAALVFDGWDTHANEGGATGRLATLLSGLDGSFDEFQSGLGDAWASTAIVAVTEFGRTARINGTVGTDHGTGTVAFLAGGAVRGGRILGDWPGLKPADLYQDRDLRATTDLRAVFKGALKKQFDLSDNVLSEKVFPDSRAVKSLDI